MDPDSVDETSIHFAIYRYFFNRLIPYKAVATLRKSDDSASDTLMIFDIGMFDTAYNVSVYISAHGFVRVVGRNPLKILGDVQLADIDAMDKIFELIDNFMMLSVDLREITKLIGV